MPHITFIHGIANKPPEDILLQDWVSSLEQGGLNLGASGVTTSMVYWADVMYPSFESATGSYESVDDGLGTADQDDDLAWTESLEGDEQALVEALRSKLRFDVSEDGELSLNMPEESIVNPDGQLAFEAIPLPWFIKKRVMKRLLKDVYYYLFNKRFSPRPGEEYQVRDHIRNLFTQQLETDAQTNHGGPHIVVSHSMGTVIAYDCLKNVANCPSVSGLMTVGSPLGISEVYDNLKPGYSRRDGFPSEKLAGSWINVYDRLDPVALDARISNDYQRDSQKVIIDQEVKNTGKWRHSSWKYFGQPTLCDHLKTLLQL